MGEKHHVIRTIKQAIRNIINNIINIRKRPRPEELFIDEKRRFHLLISEFIITYKKKKKKIMKER